MKVKDAILIIALTFGTLAAEAKILTENQVEGLAKKISQETGVRWELLASIAKVESNYNTKAIGSSHGEIGLMQLRPDYFKDASFNPEANMRLAARYLKVLERQCSAYGEAYFVCYNFGSTKRLRKPEQTQYFKKVSSELARRKASTRFMVSNAYMWRPMDNLFSH